MGTETNAVWSVTGLMREAEGVCWRLGWVLFHTAEWSPLGTQLEWEAAPFWGFSAGLPVFPLPSHFAAPCAEAWWHWPGLPSGAPLVDNACAVWRSGRFACRLISLLDKVQRRNQW